MNAASIAHALGGRKSGSGWTARCPAHDDRDPSLSISISPEGKILVYCHAGCPQNEVIEALTKLALWNSEIGNRRQARIGNEGFHDYEAQRQTLALEIWNCAVPASGTLAERYLARRAITSPLPDRIRFHHALPHKPSGTTMPAVVALVTGAGDEPLGVHRTYLSHNGNEKAPVDPPRMMLGACRGGAVRLGAIRPGQWLVVAEGIETTLSVMQPCGLLGIAALSANGIRNLVLPHAAKMVLLCADNDENGTGRFAAATARARFRAEGRRVRLIVPPDRGTDFNDVLMQQSEPDGGCDVG